VHAPSHFHPRRPRLIAGAAISGAFCALLGLLALFGWYCHIPQLVQVQPGMAPMQYNSALCFVLMGLALEAWTCGRTRRALPVLGGIVALMGALTLGEYLFRARLGIDQLFFRCYIATGSSVMGRMSPVAAFSFLLGGSAMVLLTGATGPRWRALAVGSAASVTISISLVAIAGYGFDLPGAYGWGQFTRLAAHSAAGLG
jgi:hypothetical protein